MMKSTFHDKILSLLGFDTMRLPLSGTESGAPVDEAVVNEMRFSPSAGVGMRMEAIPKDKQPAACVACGACSKMCPQSIDIPAAHIYDRHIPIVEELLAREPFPAPRLEINPGVTDFYAFTPQDFSLKDYEYHPFDSKFEVAI